MPDETLPDETKPPEHVSHDGPAPRVEPPVPPPHPMGLAVTALGLAHGDVLVVRSSSKTPPPVPAGVQVWMLGDADLVRLTPQDLLGLGWVRSKA